MVPPRCAPSPVKLPYRHPPSAMPVSDRHPADDGRPTCRYCQHYTITHDPVFRYGCRALGFKSRGQPCLEVLSASGEQCLYFVAKPKSRGEGKR